MLYALYMPWFDFQCFVVYWIGHKCNASSCLSDWIFGQMHSGVLVMHTAGTGELM